MLHKEEMRLSGLKTESQYFGMKYLHSGKKRDMGDFREKYLKSPTKFS